MQVPGEWTATWGHVDPRAMLLRGAVLIWMACAVTQHHGNIQPWIPVEGHNWVCRTSSVDIYLDVCGLCYSGDLENNKFGKLGDYLNCSFPYLALGNLALYLTGCFSKWVCSTQLPHGIADPDDTVSSRYISTATTGKGKIIQMAWVKESWLCPLTEGRQL